MNEEKQKVAVTVLWRGTELIMEERWLDIGDGLQETRYAFPGGKPEPGETLRQTAAREAFEETGISLDPKKICKKADVIEADNCEGHVFNIPLEMDTQVEADGIVIWSRQDLMKHKNSGKLMPLTDKYVEDYF
jgi:8-oxo-dGTP pyrophosphatase MutT (NUDIX family)